MNSYEWNDGLTDKESKDGAYWERNMLALYLAHNLNKFSQDYGFKPDCGWYYDTDNNWDGWKRVISLGNGKITFHIPDNFDTGELQQINSNWDGHTTREKWEMIMRLCGCKVD